MITMTHIYNDCKRMGACALVMLALCIFSCTRAYAATSKWDGTAPATTWNAANITAAGITGAGTQANPYVIHDAKGFVYFWWAANNGKLTSSTQYWKLDVDIDIDNHSWPYTNKNGTFKGKFDGQNHTISHMLLEPSTGNYNYGLFCMIEGQAADNRAQVKNLVIDSATIAPSADLKETTSVGIVVGKSSKYADMVNVKVINSTIAYSKNITGNNYVGGIVGQTLSDSKLTNCYVDSLTITTSGTTTSAYFGGLIGYIGSQTSVTGCKTNNVIITYNAIANASRISGFIGYAKGSATLAVTISNDTVTNTTIHLKQGINNGNYIGAFLGQTANNVQVNNNKVVSPSVTIDGNIAVASYIGGAVGDFAGYTGNPVTTMDGLTVTSPVVTVNKNGVANTAIGAAIGRISTYAAVKNVTVSKPTLTYKATDNPNFILNLGSFAGQMAGNATQEVTVTDIQITDTARVIVGTGSSNLCNIRAGLVGIASTNVLLRNWTVANTVVLMKGNLTAASSYVGGIVAYASTGASQPVTLRNIKITNKDSIVVSGNVDITSYVGGVAGYLYVQNSTSQAPHYVDSISVSGLDIAFGGNFTNTLYVGGAIGSVTAVAATDKLSRCVVSGKIRSTGAHTFVNGNKTYAFGGIVGYLPQSTTAFSDVSRCISEVNFDFSSMTPATKSGSSYNLYQSGFVVGGVIGRINTPSLLPAQLYYSGKIYAPFAAVGPVVGVFNTNLQVGTYTYNDYSGVNAPAVIPAEWEKANTWYYSGYKLGLSNDVLTQTARTKNFTASPETIDGLKYLNINGSTFKQSNQINQIDMVSRTVLAYTQNNKDLDLGIFPAWNTNSTTYPAYYMYYMQGVNRGTYLADSQVAATKARFLSNAVYLTLTDDNANYTLAANRGFVPHTLRVTANETVTYKWYVDDVLQSGSGNTLVLTPAVEGNNIRVEAIKGGICVAQAYYLLRAVLRVTNPAAATGTSTNPYLIGTAKELQLLSYLSTLPTNLYWEKNYISSSHYNKAYYELDADIDLSGIANFKPIAFPKSTNTDGMFGGYSQSFVFDGVFDGKLHTISGLKETWYAGSLNTNNQNVAWGLFAFVGNSTANKKVGDGSNSNAVIKNLIIDNATLTHDQNNTSFYYNNGVSGNANYCHVGVLAGIVSSNTTIQNIEIRNSKITDDGSYPYSLAKLGLHVGGAIGSLQNAFNNTSITPANTQVQHIVAQVDITLTQPTFVNNTASDQLGQFNIGGIIGRYIATSATQVQVQPVMPAYTFYSGNITAPKAWISPVLGALRYKDQLTIGFSTFSKQWEGNNNTAATQLTITNAQYYNFRIGGAPITNLYPANICNNGARTIGLHTDAAEAVATYDAKNYQGVNYNARHVDTEGVSLQPLNENAYDNVYWHWENGFPHMRAGEIYKGAYLTRSDNTLTAQMANGTASAYRWQISFDGENWQDIAGATAATYVASPSNKTKLIAAIVTSDGTNYRTQVEAIRSVTGLYTPGIVKTGNASSGYTFTIDWGANVPAGTLDVTYQWYKSDKTTALAGKSGSAITMSQSELTAAGGYIWCAVSIEEFGEKLSSWMLVAGDLNVVYVKGNGGLDTNNGRSPETPVKTIDKANSLLTTPQNGGTWDNNVIVVMGELTTDGDFRSNGKNPATLTGRWNGVDYEGIIQIKQLKEGDEHQLNPVCKGQTGLSSYVLADTKFEYLTFKANSNGDGNNLLELHGNDVWFGKGLEMKNFKKLSDSHGNLDNAQNIPEFTVVLTCSNPNEATLRKYTANRVKPQVITVESGHYGRFVGGRFTDGFFKKAENTGHSIQGSAEHPMWAIINVDIDKDNPNTDNYTCDINAIVAGLTDGTMFGDMEINLHGGKISYVVGANQGNCVVSGDKTFTPEGGVSGTYGQWPNSSFFGRTVINIDEQDGLKPLEVQSIYAGGLGRSSDPAKAPTVVDMYVYGRTAINVKKGTINGELYGGGAGGVLGKNPWDAHVPYATTAADDANTAVMNKVQYGTWGAKQPGDALATVTLHNPDGHGGYTTEMLRLDSSSTTINISGGTVNGSVYGGGYGYVSNMPEVITLQGVGSVFGNSTLNITGGTINGSVYGGSRGHNKYYGITNKYGQTITHIAELNGNVSVNISGTPEKYPTITGDIYGGGAGVESNGGEEYLRIATTGNTDLGDEYKAEITVTIDLPEEYTFTGDIYGGGEMGTVDGNTTVIIKNGTIEGNVFGGGNGELLHPNKAKVNGKTKVQIGE